MIEPHTYNNILLQRQKPTTRAIIKFDSNRKIVAVFSSALLFMRHIKVTNRIATGKLRKGYKLDDYTYQYEDYFNAEQEFIQL